LALQSCYAYSRNIARSRSWARSPSPFVYATKGPKRLVIRYASLPHKAFALQIRQNLGWKHLRPYCAHCPLRCKNLLCPVIALKAIIVLPDFTRSFSNDWKELKKIENIVQVEDFK